MDLKTLIPLVLQGSVILLVFALGLKASPSDTAYLFRRPVKLIRALLAMNVLMPLFAVAVAALFELHPAIKITLIGLSLSPIPPLLPNKIVKSGGTDSHAIGLLIAMGVLSVITVPLTVLLFVPLSNAPLHMPVGPIAKVILITILLPIGLGMLVHSLAPALAERIAKSISMFAGIALLLSFLAVFIAASPAVWELIGNGTLVVLVAFVIIGLAVGHLFGGPAPENRTSLAIATASRHPGIAIAIASVNFPEEKLVFAAILLYLVVVAVASIPYLVWIKRGLPGVVPQTDV